MEKVDIRTSPTRLKNLIVGHKVFRSSNDYEISPEDEEKARLEINETEEVRTKSLQKLREMLSREEILCRTDDTYLLRFLRCRKFKCDEAHKMVRYFYSVKKGNPEVFCTVIPDLQELLNTKIFTYLPYRDEEGSVIFVDRFGKWNPDQHSHYDLLQFFQNIADVICMNPACQINKIVGILDCEGINMRHIAAMSNPSSIMFVLKTLQNMHPWRIKCVLLVNCHRVMHTWNFVRRFVKKKIAERIVILGSDMSELRKYVNPGILPKEYGGYLEEKEWSINQHMTDNVSYLQYEYSFFNPKKP